MVSSSSSFLQELKHAWEKDIQPVIEDVFGSITQIIEKTSNNPNIFRKCEPVDLYTHIYKMTIHYQFDFCHLDFLYHQEINSIRIFCSRFQIHSLPEMNRQILGFKIILKWFHVFFHHLNRFRCRAYYNSYTIEEDMVHTIRTHYLKPQLSMISQLICGKWDKIRNNNYTMDPLLLDSMKLLSSFHPKYHNDQLLSLYFKHLRASSQKKSGVWYSQDNILLYMDNVNRCFEQEKKMFSHYFSQQAHEELDQICTILKKSFIYPYCDDFLQDARYGWKPLMFSHHMPDIQTAYQYFSWMDEPSLWLFLYQQYLEEQIASFPIDNMVCQMAVLLKRQTSLLDDVFKDDKLRICFTTALGKSIQKAMYDNDQIVVHLVKSMHHHIPKNSSKQTLKDLSALVAFCPAKDLFYEHYHYFLKTRLLMGRHHLTHEEMMLNIFYAKLGISFVLNLRFMMEEIQKNCISHGRYSLNKLSSVVWKLDRDKPLQYRSPPSVRLNIQKLYDRMRLETPSSVQLNMLWHQGAVVLTRNGTDFYMNPIQAIVLMALEAPQTREQLVRKLQIEDDTQHNLDGVLDSLSKAMMIVKKKYAGKWSWCAHSTQRNNITKVFVPPIRKPEQMKTDCGHTLGPIVMHAFIVKTLKQERIMKYSQLTDIVSGRYNDALPVDVKQSIETLIEKEYISKDEHNNLHYIP